MIGKLDPEVLRTNDEKMNKRGKIIGTTMMIGSFLITILFGFLAFQSFQKYSWSETKGKVTVSIYTREASTDQARAYYEYEYIVDDVTYTGKDSEIGSIVSVKRPPVEGASIAVYYNPQDPRESLVDTNYSDSLSDFVVWGVCCGPIFFLFGAVFYFVSTRKQGNLVIKV